MNKNKPELDSLFLAALEIESPAECAEFLEKSCGGDQQLRAQVEQLLRSHREAGSFLEKPAPEFEATMVQVKQDDETPSEAVAVAKGNHSVLKSIGWTLDHVPHVALRDAIEEGDDPIMRPASPEFPDRNSDSRYQLQGEIARGGMGAIIKGRDTDLGRDLAIKVLLDQHKDDPEVVQRFIEEAHIGGQLQHPGIAPVYELGQFSDNRPFFSMKLVKGQTLSAMLAERENSTADRAKFLGIFEQVCQTMAYAHSRGVIHRDLKPSNIMIGAFGEVQVMDWGLAKVLSEGGVADEKKAHDTQQGVSIIQTLGSNTPEGFGSQTQMGSVMGTPAYMPPEQALGEIDVLD
jgi:tRNA A-37 threonylcarbamoyl transferase component Bud32